MKEKMYEIRVLKTNSLYPPEDRTKVEEELKKKGEDFNYQGYTKLTSYKTASGATRIDVEPLEGNILDLYKKVMDGINLEKLDKGYKITKNTTKDKKIIKEEWLRAKPEGVQAFVDKFLEGGNER